MHKYSVVVQGPVYQWTKNFLNDYAKHDFVGQVILSSWQEDKENFEYTELSKKVEVVFNNKPANPGLGNRNLQIDSSYTGVFHSKYNYIIKTRTDMSLPYLKDMVNFFESNFKEKQIYVISNYLNFPFHPRDHVFISNYENMHELFSIPFDTIDKKLYNEYTDVRTETYIGAHYCSLINPVIKKYIENPDKYLVDNSENINESLSLWHQMIKDKTSFVAMPKHLQPYWPKHYPNGYPVKFFQNLYGEVYNED